MKNAITYRDVTIAIGIIVAMVIALTLWTWEPGEQGPGAGRHSSLPNAKELLKKSAIIVGETTELEWPAARP